MCAGHTTQPFNPHLLNQLAQSFGCGSNGCFKQPAHGHSKATIYHETMVQERDLHYRVIHRMYRSLLHMIDCNQEYKNIYNNSCEGVRRDVEEKESLPRAQNLPSRGIEPRSPA